VTARLRDMTNGATAGTSAAVTSTTFVTASFPVVLTATPADYEIDLSPELADTDCQMGGGYLE
jgi:hypothetical protein